jgi:hypothetical protein
VSQAALDQHPQDISAIPDAVEPVGDGLADRGADLRPLVQPPKSKPGKA